LFTAARVVDGPIELEFHAWDIDRFGDRGLIPYHVKFSLEGIPQHAWSKETADLIMGDEAIIRYVKVDAERQLDQCVFQCWAICKDPSKVSQMVFLSLAKYEPDPRRSAQVHFAKTRQAMDCHVFKILIHIDAIEDLMFYHYHREELIADGKISWRDFNWQFDRIDGDVNEEELQPPVRFCGQDWNHTHRHPRDDDYDQRRELNRYAPRGLLGRMANWIDSRGRSRDRQRDRVRGSGWHRGETSRGRHRQQHGDFFPLAWSDASPKEKRAIWML
jgi:hypothetical protein